MDFPRAIASAHVEPFLLAPEGFFCHLLAALPPTPPVAIGAPSSCREKSQENQHSIKHIAIGCGKADRIGRDLVSDVQT
jgi:hypothetical protein